MSKACTFSGLLENIAVAVINSSSFRSVGGLEVLVFIINILEALFVIDKVYFYTL